MSAHYPTSRGGVTWEAPGFAFGEIAGHIGCNWTPIRRYRRRAVEGGALREAEPYIPHKKAALFEVIDSPMMGCTTKRTVPLDREPLKA
jgi:hypothetical protein